MTTSAQTPEQLTLLPTADDVPVQFRLDDATRRRGLQHVAQIRALLAERTAARTAAARSRPRPATAHTAQLESTAPAGGASRRAA
jgi:hypothetical protein